MTFGFDGSPGIPAVRAGRIDLGAAGVLRLKGTACFGKGTTVRVGKNAVCTLGSDFHCNKNCLISCDKEINIGDDALLGWDVIIRDSDGHSVYEKGEKKVSEKPVHIGNHVWIAARADILKGVVIEDHSIVACKSCVSSAFHESHVLIAGVPARIVKRDMDWKA